MGGLPMAHWNIMHGVERPPPLRTVLEAARIAALQSYLTAQVADTEPFVTLVRMAAHLTQSPIAMISLMGRDHQLIRAAFGTDMQQLPRALALCNHVIADPSGAMVVPDTLTDPRFQRHPLVLAAPHIRFYAGVGLVDGDGYALGTLCVMDDKPSSITPDAMTLLRKMAVETVDALARQRAEQARWQSAATPAGYWPNKDLPDNHWHDLQSSSEPPAPSIGRARPLLLSAPGWLGIRTEHTPVPGSNHEGRLVISVAMDSPAARAGLQVDDVILTIDGRAARRRSDITGAMAGCAPGGVMRLEILRAGSVFEHEIRPEPMPMERIKRRRAG